MEQTATIEAQPVSAARRETLRALLTVAGLIALCLPSLALAWNFQDLPHFGVLQDDSLYFAGGKTFADGSEYRIQSLPSQPFQTKYPPLYPLYLSIAWRLNPSYPANVTTGLWLSWLAIPPILLLTWLWCRRQKFSDARTWILLTLIGLNPYIVFFACNIGSELFFLVFLLSALIAAERCRGRDRWWPLAAGILAGAAYLSRTAGGILLPAAIVYFLISRRRAAALWFTAGMLPAVIGWTAWCAMHATHAHDLVNMYYTSYLGWQSLNVGWNNLLSVVWQNFDALLEATGSIIFPQVLQGLAAKLVLQPLAIFVIFGCVRMFRNGEARLYSLFGLFSAALMLVWHGPSSQRLILHLVPLILAGFCCQTAHLWSSLQIAFRHRDRSQRAAARAIAGVLGFVFAAGFVFQIYMTVSAFPELFREDREKERAFRQLYRWVEANVPATANLMWERDVDLYLTTGRHATSRPIPSRLWYAYGFDRDMDYYRNLDQFAREQHVEYVIISTAGREPKPEPLRTVASNPQFERIHAEPGGVVFKLGGLTSADLTVSPSVSKVNQEPDQHPH